jgi:hypothetical protein
MTEQNPQDYMQIAQASGGMLTDEVVDKHLDAVLRSSGSALKYFSMEKTKAAMRAAMRAAMLAAAPAAPAPAVDEEWQPVFVGTNTEKCGCTHALYSLQVTDCGGEFDESRPPKLYTRPAADAPARIKRSAPWNALTDEDRKRALESMPDWLDGFLKTWGWLNFAKAIESICREKNPPGTGADVLADAEIRRIAQLFSDRIADMCGVDREDHWKYHSEDVVDDVKFIFAARAKEGAK